MVAVVAAAAILALAPALPPDILPSDADGSEVGEATEVAAEVEQVFDKKGRIEFNMHIQKAPFGPGLGVNISPHDGITLLIGRVKSGPVKNWNRDRGTDALDVVQRGDRIVAVNSVSGDAGMLLNTLRAESQLCITISRLMEFKAKVKRHGNEDLGLDLQEVGTEKLLVEAVGPGLVAEGNRRVGVELEIREGDTLQSVDGISNDARRMRAALETLERGREIELLVRRPAKWNPREIISAEIEL